MSSDAARISADQTVVQTDELRRLQLTKKRFDELLDIFRYSHVTADAVVKSLVSDKLKEIARDEAWHILNANAKDI